MFWKEKFNCYNWHNIIYGQIMFTIDLKDKTLNTLTELKDTYAISNELAKHCDIFAEAINNDKIPENIRENICNFIKSCLNNDIQSLDSRIYYGNNVTKILKENYKLNELKYEKEASKYDMTQETIFILGSIVVTLAALLSGSGILVAGASIGLGLALSDMFYRMPNDIHSELKHDSEYINLSLTEKASCISKEIFNDKVKLSCAAINLAGASFLFAVLFSPALIMSAPISVPSIIGVMCAVGLFSIGKKYYKYKSELKEIEENTKNIHNYSNITIKSIGTFNSVLNDAEQEKIKIEDSTHVSDDATSKSIFPLPSFPTPSIDDRVIRESIEETDTESRRRHCYRESREETDTEGEDSNFDDNTNKEETNVVKSDKNGVYTRLNNNDDDEGGPSTGKNKNEKETNAVKSDKNGGYTSVNNNNDDDEDGEGEHSPSP